MYVRNKLGGIDPEDKHLIERSKQADLVTLPKDVKGTNCYNCMYITDKRKEAGYCKHPKVKMLVDEKMCCSYWDNKGVHRSFGKIDSKYK